MIGLQTISFLVIAGLLMVFTVMQVTGDGLIKSQKPRLETKNSTLDLQDYFSDFVEANGRLPCPARMDLFPEDPNYGKEAGTPGDCSTGATATGSVANGLVVTSNPNRSGRRIIMGAVPNRVMNMPDSEALDGYSKQFLYIVTEIETDNRSYNVETGAIEVKSQNHQHITTEPGHALYALISTGGKGGDTGTTQNQSLLDHFANCDTSTQITIPDPYGSAGSTIDVLDGDSENCDGDFIFKNSDWSLQTSTAYFDDHISFSEYEPRNTSPFALCGAKGMVYARSNPNADSQGCLDIMLVAKAMEKTFQDTPTTVTCPPASGTNCLDTSLTDGWFEIEDVQAGEYLFTWTGNVKFTHPQAGQYATLDLKIEEYLDLTGDGINDIGAPRQSMSESHPIIYDSVSCAVGADCPSQPVKGTGIVKTIYSGKLYGRLKLFNNGATYGAGNPHGAGNNASVALVSAGDTATSGISKSAFHIVGNRRAATATSSEIVMAPRSTMSGLSPSEVTNPCSGLTPPAGCDAGIVEISIIDKEAQIVRADGTVETVTGDITLKPGDTIKSNQNTAIELVFLDGTVILLTADTTLRIDDYAYTPLTPTTLDDKIEVTLLEGVILYVSGLMDKSPGSGLSDANVKINTEYGSAGIRGTVVMVYHESSTNPSGKKNKKKISQFLKIDREGQGTGPTIPSSIWPEGKSVFYVASNPATAGTGGGTANSGPARITNPFTYAEVKLNYNKVKVDDDSDEENFCKVYNKISSTRSKEALLSYIDGLDANHNDYHYIKFTEDMKNLSGSTVSIYDIATSSSECKNKQSANDGKKNKGDDDDDDDDDD